MIVTFFDKDGMIYTHTVPAKTSKEKNGVTGERYKAILTQLMREHLPRKRPQYANGNWKLHMDNARAHTCEEKWHPDRSAPLRLLPLSGDEKKNARRPIHLPARHHK